jgi:hypothetical protein
MTDIITARLYGGRVTVDLNPKNHRYHVSDIKAAPDGVTTLCNGTIPKFNLLDWAGGVGPQEIRDECLRILEATGLFPETTAFLSICEYAEKAHERHKESAGGSGSKAHDLIERHIKGKPLEIEQGKISYIDEKTRDLVEITDPLAITGFKAGLAWLAKTDIEILECERLVYSEKYFYCGKTDFVGRRNGKLLIGDFKTGNTAGYESEWYQLAAYALAIEEETGDNIEEGLIVHLDKKTGRYKEYHVTIDDDMKGAWKAAVIHYKNLKRVRKLVEEKRNGT